MKLNIKQARLSIRRQIYDMGCADFLMGNRACPFAERSRAALHWRKGWQDAAARFPLFAQEAIA